MSEKKHYHYIYNNDGTEMIEYNNGHYIMDMDDATELLNEQYQQIKQLEQELSEMKDKAYENKCGWIEEFGCNIESQKEEARKEIYGEKAEQKRLQELKKDIEQKIISKNIPFEEKIRPVWARYNELNPHNDLAHKRVEKSCSNCTHHTWDWDIDDGHYGDEYEVCLKNQDPQSGPCEHYEEM